MTALPTKTHLTSGATTEAQFQAAIGALYDVLAEVPGVSAKEELAIELGAIAPTGGFIVVDTENLSAADDLTNIDATALGARMLFLQIKSAARPITLKHLGSGSGQLDLLTKVDFTMSSVDQLVVLMYDDSTSIWKELYRNDGFNYSGGVMDKTANYTVKKADDGKVIRSMLTNLTFTLPPAASVGNRFIITILLGATGTVTIDGDGTELINDSETLTLNKKYASAMLISDGVNRWYRIAYDEPPEAIPVGGIIMWSGTVANIPAGWYLCDGSNGTPDVRDRMIVAARADNAGQAMTQMTGSFTKAGGSYSTITGETTLSIFQIPAHFHTTNTVVSKTDGDQNGGIGVRFVSFGNVQSSSTGGGGPHSHTVQPPPYYALAFIMKGASA